LHCCIQWDKGLKSSSIALWCWLAAVADCDAIIDFSSKISRMHCVLVQVDANYFIRDLGSLNGIRVNGERVAKEALLLQGAEVAIGDVIYHFHANVQPAPRMPVRNQAGTHKLPAFVDKSIPIIDAEIVDDEIVDAEIIDDVQLVEDVQIVEIVEEIEIVQEVEVIDDIVEVVDVIEDIEVIEVVDVIEDVEIIEDMENCIRRCFASSTTTTIEIVNRNYPSAIGCRKSRGFGQSLSNPRSTRKQST
jgi:hypothetical protein